MIELTKGLLRLSDDAVKVLNVKHKDQLSLTYICDDGEVEIPVLSTPEAVGEKKGFAVSTRSALAIRGLANDELARYGTKFTLRVLEDYNPLVYQLVPILSNK